MIKKLLLLTFLAFTFNTSHAQWTILQQYFDGADTSMFNSIIIQLDTSSNNIWQVGPPQKSVFDSAATAPNALVTDTINTYPVNNTSSFSFSYNLHAYSQGGVLAIRWKQKLDMDSAMDGGIIEYSIDTGNTWKNVFTDTTVYNFYGFDSTNVDTLADGTHAFTGTDSVWRDIWLCFIRNTANTLFKFRFTFRSDSIDNNRDGWMIDNMFIQPTIFHTVNTVNPQSTFLVYPTITSGIVKVATGDKKNKIENILVLDAQGRIVKRHNGQADISVLDISDLPASNYFVHVSSGEKIEVHQITLTQ